MHKLPYLRGWDLPNAFIPEEVKQLKEEGREAQAIDALVGSLAVKEASEATVAELWYKLQEAPVDKNYPWVEPSDLESIQAQRTEGPRQIALGYDDAELLKRLHGAWLARCSGCALGRPVECFMWPSNGLSSPERIEAYLKGISPSEYPLNDYFPQHSPAEEKAGKVGCHQSTRENIKFMESDDDLRYTVIGQKVLRDHGASFKSEHVMDMWLSVLPYRALCTAETQAYRNYVIRYQAHPGIPTEVDWTWVATHQNPYREWIGAQIRADSWGYAAPGNPALAAEFAWRDARISHVRNGIYGEMFCAALIAAAFAVKDPLEAVEAALAEIPQKSRLHADIREVIAICRRHNFDAADFEAALADLGKALGHYHPVHTNNNAGLVVAALLLGQHDFEKVLSIAVMGGWDTDCNGATAGSVFGAMHGVESIPPKWSAPLHDTLYSEIFGYHPIAISEVARLALEVAQKVRG